MNDIPTELSAEVMREVWEGKGCPDESEVPIDELAGDRMHRSSTRTDYCSSG